MEQYSETCMQRSISVNEAIEQLAQTTNVIFTVRGNLNFEFENRSLRHYPVAERHDDPYTSAIWLSAGHGSIQFNEAVLTRWHGKRVLVTGTLYGPSEGFRGCGHMSLFAAGLLVASIERA